MAELGSVLENQAKVQLQEQEHILEKRCQLEEEKEQVKEGQEQVDKDRAVQQVSHSYKGSKLSEAQTTGMHGESKEQMKKHWAV